MMGRGDALNIAKKGAYTKEEIASLKAMRAVIDSRLGPESGASEVATDPNPILSDPITNGSLDSADTTMSMDDNEPTRPESEL